MIETIRKELLKRYEIRPDDELDGVDIYRYSPEDAIKVGMNKDQTKIIMIDFNQRNGHRYSFTSTTDYRVVVVFIAEKQGKFF